MTCWKENFLHSQPKDFRVRIQINLLITFLKSGGQLCALEDYWPQVGDATEHSASVAASIGVQHTFLLVNFGFSSRL